MGDWMGYRQRPVAQYKWMVVVLQSFGITLMEGQMDIEAVSSVVPVSQLQNFSTLSHRHWHLVCSASYIVPVGLQALRVSMFLVLYDRRLYLTIVFEFISMLPAPQMDLEIPHLPQIWDHANSESIPLPCGAIPMPCGAIPMAYGIFEMPHCAECLLEAACPIHKQAQ